MGKLIVLGGSRLEGEIVISGAKNAALPILAATILNEESCIIRNIPSLTDIKVMIEVLESLGAKIEEFESHGLKIDSCQINSGDVSEVLMRKMRASSLVMGPLLGRFKKAKVSFPGGCAIGSRPIDLHIKGFKMLGADIKEEYGYIIANADKLIGAEIHLDYPSVGATENIMMAAVFAEGDTTIKNAAQEPEVVDLQNFLNQMGARIQGAGTAEIMIQGVSKLHNAEYDVMPDRIEAGTYMVGATLTKGDVVLKNVKYEHIESIAAKLVEIGAKIVFDNDKCNLRIMGPATFSPFDLKTLPYPGFPTDMQPQMMVLATLGEGTSIITETIFENRFQHVPELRRMGAEIKLEGTTAVVRGKGRLSGTFVSATDLRAGAALVLAGLVSDGATIVEEIHHIERGYENFQEKLVKLGARIEIIRD